MKNEKHSLTVINSNARSLCPKINSLIDCFDETKASIGIITETWLTDGNGLDDDVDDLLHGAGLGFLYKNRAANSRGFSHGGVGIFFREGDLSLTQMKMYNPDNYEVLSAIGTIKGLSRKIVVISCYLPPTMR